MEYHSWPLEAACTLGLAALLTMAAGGRVCLAQEGKQMTSSLSESILKRLDAGDSFSSREAMDFRRQPDAVAKLSAAIEHGEAPRREAGVRLLISWQGSHPRSGRPA